MLLALETSDRNCAVAIADPATGTIVASITEDIGRGHAERLMGMIDAVFAEAVCTYKDLTAVAVCVGPGSFTGIRVALATATGLSITLGIPVTGVTALQALAFNGVEKIEGWRTRPKSADGEAEAHNLRVISVIDAHRGDVYMQTFSSELSPLDLPRQISVHAAFEEVRLLKGLGVLSFGNGFPLLWQEWEKFLKMEGFTNLEVNTSNVVAGLHKRACELPSVEAVARAALDPRFTVEPKPLYLRRPDAKPQEAYTERRALRT